MDRHRRVCEYTSLCLARRRYFWIEDAYHSENNGPFSTHKPANIIVYDPGLVADQSTNMLNLRAGLRFDRWTYRCSSTT